MAEIQTDKLEALLQTLQGITPEEMQSGDSVRDHLVSLTSWMAWTGEQMALANKAYNIAKRDAYHKLQSDFEKKGLKLSPMLAKDYIGSLCSKEAYSYEIAERANRTCYHAIEAFRSVLSSLKNELQTISNAA